MIETISQILSRSNVDHETFLQVFLASGHLDINIHRLLSVALDARLTNNNWNYRLKPWVLLQLIELEITKKHNISLPEQMNAEMEIAALKQLTEFYQDAINNPHIKQWLERDKLNKEESIVLAQNSVKYAVRYEVMLKKMLDIIPLQKIQYSSWIVEALKCAIQNPDSFGLLLSNYPEEQRFQILQRTVLNPARRSIQMMRHMPALIFFTCENLKTLEICLSLIPEAERLKAVSEELVSGGFDRAVEWSTLLKMASRTSGAIEVILQSLPEKDRSYLINTNPSIASSLPQSELIDYSHQSQSLRF